MSQQAAESPVFDAEHRLAPRYADRIATLLLVVVVGLGTLAVLAAAAPAARGVKSPATEFSAERAMEHVRAIAQRPHPTGTADNARVRDYLVATAKALGAQVRVESGEVVRPDWGNPFPVAVVHNVIATVPGTDPRVDKGTTLLLVAHYDSVPTGPGAADNGAAVSALLESLRALQAGPGVAADVVFLFTDGEELGGLGAEMFVQRTGVGRFGAVLNWEARGSRGPVLMFETSIGNEPLIEAFAAATDHPSTNSLAYEIYRRLPNDSDFTVFRRAGASGTNAAFIDGFHEYHSPYDDPERLSPDSVQHHGEYALGMIRELANGDLRKLSAAGRRDMIYSDLFQRVVVRYPSDWAIPLAVSTIAALLLAVARSVRRGHARVGGVLAVAGAGLGAAMVSAVATFAAWQAVLAARPALAALPLAEPYSRGGFVAGFGLLTLGAALAAAGLLRRRRSAELLGGAALLLGTLLALCVSIVPGASYLLQWPLLLALPALWWAGRPVAALVLTLLPAGLAAVLFAPLANHLVLALGVPLAAPVALLAGTAMVLLMPWLARLPRPPLLAGVCAALAVATLFGATATAGFGPANPRPNSLVYVLDRTEGGGAKWISGDPEPDEWTSRVLGDAPATGDGQAYYPQRGSEPLLTAPAALVEMVAPIVTTLADSTAGDVRTVAMRVTSVRDAWQLQVRLPRSMVHACTVAGLHLTAKQLAVQGGGGDGVVFQIWGASDGIDLTCEVTAGIPLPVDVADYTTGLTPPVAVLVGPRPPGTVPVSWGFAPTDSTVVRHIVTL